MDTALDWTSRRQITSSSTIERRERKYSNRPTTLASPKSFRSSRAICLVSFSPPGVYGKLLIPHNAELGLRSTAYILSSSDPLSTFVELTSNFPLLASQLAQLVPHVDGALASEIETNQLKHPTLFRNSFSINGVALSDADVDPFALLRIMRKERQFVLDVEQLDQNISIKQAREILMHKGIGAAAKTGVAADGRVTAESLGEIFDASDREEGGDLILWWNDLTKDKRYSKWSKDIQEVFQSIPLLDKS